ncbi:MAG: hypothetical protein ACI8QS_002910 [Planctomycetota bacterium]|jgi:hypothetical protein
MNSRVHPTYKTKYRVTNWSECDHALVQLGDITLWISQEAVEARDAGSTARRWAPQRYSDLAIDTALACKLQNPLMAIGHPRSVALRG